MWAGWAHRPCRPRGDSAQVPKSPQSREKTAQASVWEGVVHLAQEDQQDPQGEVAGRASLLGTPARALSLAGIGQSLPTAVKKDEGLDLGRQQERWH